MSETEQNKTEEATPHKLRKAREKGQIARGTDLAFFGTLLALIFFILVLGAGFVESFARLTGRMLSVGVREAVDTDTVMTRIGETVAPATSLLFTLGGLVVGVVLLLEIIQMRGLLFTTFPLKPDFTKLNPAKGLKRIFSMKMLKEALKNILKMALYLTTAALVIRYAVLMFADRLYDATDLTLAMTRSATIMLAVFAMIALGVAAIDQIITRQEFKKQMRMSQSEVKRERKDREGDPRLRQKRKQIHAEYVKQAGDAGDISGTDLVIVNPQHYAVALSYSPKDMQAPTIVAKGCNLFALDIKKRALALNIPVFEEPELARGLYKVTDKGDEISATHYQAVADIYLKLQAT